MNKMVLIEKSNLYIKCIMNIVLNILIGNHPNNYKKFGYNYYHYRCVCFQLEASFKLISMIFL